MSFWQRVKFISSAVFERLLPFIKKFLSANAQAILPIVAQAVAYMATQNNMSWNEKRDAALEMVKEEATKKAISVSTGFILDCIQVEVANLNVSK